MWFAQRSLISYSVLPTTWDALHCMVILELQAASDRTFLAFLRFCSSIIMWLSTAEIREIAELLNGIPWAESHSSFWQSSLALHYLEFLLLRFQLWSVCWGLLASNWVTRETLCNVPELSTLLPASRELLLEFCGKELVTVRAHKIFT